jgi:hypothetical protein
VKITIVSSSNNVTVVEEESANTYGGSIAKFTL